MVILNASNVHRKVFNLKMFTQSIAMNGIKTKHTTLSFFFQEGITFEA